MCRTILVPLDGSPVAEQALPLALRIAERAGAALRLVKVHLNYLLKDSASCWAPRFEPHLEKRWLAEEQAYLDSVRQWLQALTSTRVTTSVNQSKSIGGLSDPPDGILDEARTSRADLLVMVSSQRGRLERLLFGSTPDEVTRRSAVPVLLLPPKPWMRNRVEERVPRHMMICLDGTPFSENVMEPALDLGGHLDVRYTLLQVPKSTLWNGDIHQNDASKQLNDEAACDYLTSRGERLSFNKTFLQSRITHGRVAQTILELAKRQSADLIAIAGISACWWKRVLLGSLADQIQRHTSIPLLMCQNASVGGTD